MPWGRQDDGFYDHPKVRRLPVAIRNEACGLYWRAISLCNRQLTDGRVTVEDVLFLDGSEDLAGELVKVQLFDRTGRAYRVHDFLGFNKSRAQVLAERVKRATAGRQGGIASGRNRRRSKREAKAEAEPKQGAQQVASHVLEPPSRPVPSRPTQLPDGSAPPDPPGGGMSAPYGQGWTHEELTRDGLPHLGPDLVAEGQSLTGYSFARAGQTWQTELDRLTEVHGADGVRDAMHHYGESVNGKRPSWPQLVAAVRNDLEPLPASRRMTDQDRRTAEREALLAKVPPEHRRAR